MQLETREDHRHTCCQPGTSTWEHNVGISLVVTTAVVYLRTRARVLLFVCKSHSLRFKCNPMPLKKPSLHSQRLCDPPPSSIVPHHLWHAIIGVSGPHARTRAGKGCRPRELSNQSCQHFRLFVYICVVDARRMRSWVRVPGPLTFRMMLRVWSSMNSTRTWVTPPREPSANSQIFYISRISCVDIAVSSSAAGCVPVRPRTRVTFTSLTGCLADSILTSCSKNKSRFEQCNRSEVSLVY